MPSVPSGMSFESLDRIRPIKLVLTWPVLERGRNDIKGATKGSLASYYGGVWAVIQRAGIPTEARRAKIQTGGQTLSLCNKVAYLEAASSRAKPWKPVARVPVWRGKRVVKPQKIVSVFSQVTRVKGFIARPSEGRCGWRLEPVNSQPPPRSLSLSFSVSLWALKQSF